MLAVADLIERPPPMEPTQAPRAREETPETCAGSSAKIDQLIQLLKLIPTDEKCLVFSQFTSFLDKVVEAFEEEGYVTVNYPAFIRPLRICGVRLSFVRFDGKMSARRRQEAIEKFSVPLKKAPQHEPTPTAPASSSRLNALRRTSSRRSSTRKVSYATGEGSDSDDDFMPVENDSTDEEDKDLEKDMADDDIDLSASVDGGNPRVMLISLKAVCDPRTQSLLRCVLSMIVGCPRLEFDCRE